MKNLFVLIFFSLLLSNATFAQQPDAEGSLVKWMTLEEAMEKVKTQPRPVILDFYTDWCGWCKRMMATTYASPALAQYINTNFYPVKFNAETKDTVEYLGVKYAPVSDAPRTAHPLAVKLLQGKLSYPTTLFLNNYDKQKNEFQFSMIAAGYLEIKKIEPILVFQLENVFRNSSYEDFERNYNKAFYDTSVTNHLSELPWTKPADFFGKRDSSDKKTLVFLHTDWCNACRVMYRTSFSDSINQKFLNDKFDWVDFSVEMKEPITFRGQTFANNNPQMPFHQLAMAFCRNSITLPTLVILDEKMTVLDAVPYYLNPKVLKDITTYYGGNVYKTKSWAEFMKP